jgi:hypothetical protein
VTYHVAGGGPLLLAEEARRDAQLERAVLQALDVVEVAAQAHVAEDRLLEPHVDVVQRPVDADGGHLLLERAAERLQPEDVRLVAVHVRAQQLHVDHARRLEVAPDLDDLVAAAVDAPRCSGPHLPDAWSLLCIATGLIATIHLR